MANALDLVKESVGLNILNNDKMKFVSPYNDIGKKVPAVSNPYKTPLLMTTLERQGDLLRGDALYNESKQRILNDEEERYLTDLINNGFQIQKLNQLKADYNVFDGTRGNRKIINNNDNLETIKTWVEIVRQDWKKIKPTKVENSEYEYRLQNSLNAYKKSPLFKDITKIKGQFSIPTAGKDILWANMLILGDSIFITAAGKPWATIYWYPKDRVQDIIQDLYDKNEISRINWHNNSDIIFQAPTYKELIELLWKPTQKWKGKK